MTPLGRPDKPTNGHAQGLECTGFLRKIGTGKLNRNRKRWVVGCAHCVPYASQRLLHVLQVLNPPYLVYYKNMERQTIKGIIELHSCRCRCGENTINASSFPSRVISLTCRFDRKACIFSLHAKEEGMLVNRLHPGKSMYTFEVPQKTDYGLRCSSQISRHSNTISFELTRLCCDGQTGGCEK